MSRAHRWCFTVNNYTEEDITKIQEWLTEETCKYAIVSKEVGEKKETPHLQGFINLRKIIRLTGLNKKIKAHYEVARGTDEDNKKYCEKGGDLLLEVGTPQPKTGTNASFQIAKELSEKVAAGQEDLARLIKEHEHYAQAYDKHFRFVKDNIELQKDLISRDQFIQDRGSVHLIFFRWQTELYEMLTTKKPDERKVYWYVDQKGGAGKSTFASYVLAKQQGGGTMIYTGGRKQDLAYAYNNERIVFFDLCRTDRDIEQTCKFMEELKNGRLFCTKYNSKLKLFKTPHVVVFSNNYPPYHAFSEDRIEIRVLEKKQIFKWSLSERYRDRSPRP